MKLLPILISTGFADLFLPVKNREMLAAFSPDFDRLSALCEKHGAGGGLTYYLYINGMVYSGQDCCFFQGEALKRPSKIYTSIQSVGTQAESVRIKVGGKGAVLAVGEIYL